MDEPIRMPTIPARAAGVNHAVAPSSAPSTSPTRIPITTLFMNRSLLPVLLFPARGDSFKKFEEKLRWIAGTVYSDTMLFGVRVYCPRYPRYPVLKPRPKKQHKPYHDVNQQQHQQRLVPAIKPRT